MKHFFTLFLLLSFSFFFINCSKNNEKKTEYIVLSPESEETNDSIWNNSVQSENLTYTSNKVTLTGLDSIRLISFYKIKPNQNTNINYYETEGYGYEKNYNEDDYHYFMPGLDIINGYNLINIAHYNISNEKTSYFFKKPVLINTVYFPGVKKDSIYKKPIKRNYFLVSVYDEDTNKDTLISKKDLRRLYHIDQYNTRKTLLIPKEYGVIKSTYDYKNDIMYIYTKEDQNKNGSPDKNEKMTLFWISLENPKLAKKIL